MAAAQRQGQWQGGQASGGGGWKRGVTGLLVLPQMECQERTLGAGRRPCCGLAGAGGGGKQLGPRHVWELQPRPCWGTARGDWGEQGSGDASQAVARAPGDGGAVYGHGDQTWGERALGLDPVELEAPTGRGEGCTGGRGGGPGVERTGLRPQGHGGAWSEGRESKRLAPGRREPAAGT